MEHCDGGELLKVVREGRRQGQADGCFRALGFGGYVPGLSMIQDMGRRFVATTSSSASAVLG